jgi:hypothetical protein
MDSCTRRSSIDKVVGVCNVESLKTKKQRIDQMIKTVLSIYLLFVPFNFGSVILFVIFDGTLE